jgi:AcrR family transcriptional regulator
VKTKKNQRVTIRQPRQERSLQKVELILEAAMRLLDKGGHDALTTNAVAATAGVSIGTLYQYFPHKDAILDTLAAREVAGLSKRVMAVIEDPAPRAPHERISAIVHAVTAGYGGRDQVHRLVMEHSLGRGSRKLSPLIARLIALMTSTDRPRAAGPAKPMSSADAFVATHAFVGVMRAVISGHDDVRPSREDVAGAMARMLTQFVATAN